MDVQVDAIDRVIKNTLQVMENSKHQIFEIGESARSEKEALEKELQQIKDKIKEAIARVDRLEMDFKNSRIRLSEVSRHFHKFSEEDIRRAYEIATGFQMDLTLWREKEIALRARRDELHQRIRNIEQTIERAENVVSQINVVYQYLSGDLTQISQVLETARSRQLLGLKIILAQEEERKRIAREIHDGLAQSMAHLVLRTEITERMLDGRKLDEAKKEVRDLKNQVRSGLEEVRKIIFNLRPMALDDLGLVPTLRKFAQDFEEKHKIHTRFELIGKEIRLTSAMEVAIFRFVQEAFSNVLKHAKATNIDMKMIFQPKEMIIEIKDNGVGFVSDRIDEKIKSGSHFGLVGMRERVEMLEGRFELDTKPNQGTKISMRVPVEPESNGKEGS